MAPAADVDHRLLLLQGKVATLRTEHQDLVERERVLRATKQTASADAMKVRVSRTFAEFEAASKTLAAYISKRQRGGKKE